MRNVSHSFALRKFRIPHDTLSHTQRIPCMAGETSSICVVVRLNLSHWWLSRDQRYQVVNCVKCLTRRIRQCCLALCARCSSQARCIDSFSHRFCMDRCRLSYYRSVSLVKLALSCKQPPALLPGSTRLLSLHGPWMGF